ncbi:MAG: hypothetical protein AB8B79_07330, partial [Granulosicoccus sp.]
QAADINRLFDAVDAVTEETRQARLTLERRIRVRRQELKQQALQAHVDSNAATLDALTTAQQALFQDRQYLLSLPFDELESTIAERIGVWQSTLAEPATQYAANSFDVSGHDNTQSFDSASINDGGIDAEHSSRSAGESIEHTSDTGVATDNVSRTWRVTIDLSAPRTKADQVFTRVRDRWKTDRAVVGFDLLVVD